MSLKTNLGWVDREIRGAFALVFLGNGFYFDWMWAMVVGAILALTAVVGVCPAYWPFKTSTVGLPITRT